MSMAILENVLVDAFCALPKVEQIKGLKDMADKFKNGEDIGSVSLVFEGFEQLRTAAELSYADLDMTNDEVASFKVAAAISEHEENERMDKLLRLQAASIK